MATERDNKQKQPVQDSNTLWPLMMQQTRLLIFDYDVTRYHSFDLFSTLLLDREMFNHCDAKFLDFVTTSSYSDRILFYKNKVEQLNVYEHFTNTRGLVNRDEYEKNVNAKLFKSPRAVTTETEISVNFNVIFYRDGISGYLLRYKDDPHEPLFIDQVKVYESDRILDLRMAKAIIQEHRINAVLMSSAELAVELALGLLAIGYEEPISFLLGGYRYNFIDEFQYLKNMKIMASLERKYRYEFSLFDPFSNLTYKKNLEKKLAQQDQEEEDLNNAKRDADNQES